MKSFNGNVSESGHGGGFSIVEGSMGYRLIGGTYLDVATGKEVDWDEVYYNYVRPNAEYHSVPVYTWIKVGEGKGSTGWKYQETYKMVKGPGATSQGGGNLGTTLGYVNDGLNAVGIVAGGAELFTKANAGARITYSTLSGARSWVSSAKVVSGLKAVGTYTVVGSVAVDLTLGVTGFQTPGKTVTNIGVGIGAWAIGGVPGLVIGIGYTVLDKTGMFDRPEYITPYTAPSITMPDATRVARQIIYP